jgi:Na+-driven multidrug efflux pump
MLISSAIAALLFFAITTVLMPRFGNHALWLAMTLYLVARGVVQTVISEKIK